MNTTRRNMLSWLTLTPLAAIFARKASADLAPEAIDRVYVDGNDLGEATGPIRVVRGPVLIDDTDDSEPDIEGFDRWLPAGYTVRHCSPTTKTYCAIGPEREGEWGRLHSEHERLSDAINTCFAHWRETRSTGVEP